MARDVTCGFLFLVLATVYFFIADAMPKSVLSDEVGPDGLPKIYALVLGGLSLLLIGKAALQFFKTAPSEQTAEKLLSPETRRSMLRALGLLGLGVLYLTLLPYAGYIVTITVLIAAVALYQGVRLTPRLAAIAFGGAVMMWLIFVKLLGIPLPAGLLGRLF